MSRIASFAFGVAAALTAGSAFGEVHKCGVNGGMVYQDTPCAGSIKAADPRPEREKFVPLDSGAGSQLCVREAPNHFKDPDSVKIEGASFNKLSSYENAPAKSYLMTINAKNSFGGYVGKKVYECVVTLDEKRVLAIRGGYDFSR